MAGVKKMLKIYSFKLCLSHARRFFTINVYL